MTNEDLDLLEKFKKIFESNPNDEQALDLWSSLTVEEYNRLIVLFEQNKPEGISDNIRMELVKIFKKLKAKVQGSGAA